MEQVKKLPVDIGTWREMDYDPLYYVPNPLDIVANSTIKFYENQLVQFDKQLTEDNKNIFKNLISRIENLIKFRI